MGMAASQARYLALTARKTNTEWEGQQINQARTALANQSANLFNRLLGLEVPNAPKTTDYTEVQYSFSDGDNESVIDSWQQLSSANPDYNYVVKSYYFANVYTGSQKKLEDPQVHINKEITENSFSSSTVVKKNNDGSYTVSYPDAVKLNYKEITSNLIADTDKNDENKKMQKQFNDFATAKQLAYDAGAIPSENVYGYQDASGDWHFILKEEIDNMQTQVSYDGNDNSWSIRTPNGQNEYKYNSITDQDVQNDAELEAALRDFEVAKGLAQKDGVLTTDNVFGYQDSSGTWHFFMPDNTENPSPVEYASQDVMYIGNCKATELKKLNVNDDSNSSNNTIDEATELAQILRDCGDSAISKYLSFDASGNLVYGGKGIYSFTMNGKKYYTTEDDLLSSLNSPQDPTHPIENQSRLSYYNANYLKTKIEQTNNALLETDGNGRFKSVKFDNDSVVYDLNVETVTDEAAYKDAMNEYNYKKEQYEKTIADINAKTSIIQQEDRTLELRLKQLDTEQNALATEMDAVKKVIKDNVEKTFKTFSD